MEIRDIVAQYKDTVARRRALEAEAEELKKSEELPLRDQILDYMQAHEMTSIKYDDLGQVVRVMKPHYEVRDRTKFAIAILAALVHAHKEHRALDDGLIVQMRPSRESLEVYLGDTNQEPDDVGLVLVERPELSVRKA